MSNKSEILALGCGGCGNNQLNTLLMLDRRYTGIFFNTNMREMESLPTFQKDRRCFYIPNADGTGKDRNVTASYLKSEAPKFAEMISKFTIQKYIPMFSSSNGGTGSKAVTMLPKLIKRIAPDKVITSITTFPSLDETDIDFENTIDFWNELIEQSDKGYIDNCMFIDNNKFSSEQKVNDEAIGSYNKIFDIVEGKIDSSDLSRAFREKGYNVILRLDSNINNVSDAIDKAIDDSVFFIPDNLECEVLVGTININNFSVDGIKDRIPVYGFSKINEVTEGDSIIVLAGCEIPTEPIELVREALNEIRDRANTKRSRIRNLKVDDVGGKYKTKNQISNSITPISSNDLSNLFDDDDFWD